MSAPEPSASELALPSSAPAREKGPRRFVTALSLSILLLAAFACFTTPVADIDVWWHLAAGRWIVANRTLPDVDPFGVFGPANPIRTATILKAQWLGQLALYGAWTAGGMLGVAAARASALTIAAALVYLRTRRLGGSPSTALVATAIAATALLGFPGERPQVFAFSLAGLALVFAEAWQRTGRLASLVGLALTAAVWVNIHGSVLILVATLGAVAAGEAVRSASARDWTRPARAAAAASVVAMATVVSPNGFTTWGYVVQTQSGVLASRTSEYVSSLQVSTVAGWQVAALVYAFLAFAAAGVPRLLRASPGAAAATVLLAGASIASYRYHAFLVLIATPWIATALWETAAASVRTWRRVAAAVTAAAAAVSVASVGGPLRAFAEPVTPSRIPATAVARLRELHVEGRVLVWFAWSGYLLWEAWPDALPVVDPRMLDDAALGPYTHMIWATPAGLRLLDEARVTAVLLPYRSVTGEPYPLPAVLRSRGDWAVEYTWPGGILLRRRNEGSGSVPPPQRAPTASARPG